MSRRSLHLCRREWEREQRAEAKRRAKAEKWAAKRQAADETVQPKQKPSNSAEGQVL
jgi:hypothetical protein